MKIAIDVRSLMDDRYSGVQEYALNITKSMLALPSDHEFVLFYNSAREVSLPTFEGNVEYVGHRYPNKLFNAAQWISGMPRWDWLLPDVDCVFVPGLRLVPLSGEIPLVTTVHDLSFEQFPELLTWWRKRWHSMMRPYDLLSRSSCLIAVSEHTASDIGRLYGISSDKVNVIYSGVPGEWVVSEEAKKQARERYNLPESFVLFLGTLEPRKNVASIVRAFSAIAEDVDQDLVLAGGSGWLSDELDDAIAESDVSDRIVLPGFIDEKDKAAVYALADLFVYPSLYEGFGFPPLESLLSGTPVITSHNSSLPEVVGQWATMIDPYNVSELAVVMKELLHDLPVVSSMVSEEIHRRFSWRRAAEQTLSLLEKAA